MPAAVKSLNFGMPPQRQMFWDACQRARRTPQSGKDTTYFRGDVPEYYANRVEKLKVQYCHNHTRERGKVTPTSVAEIMPHT